MTGMGGRDDEKITNIIFFYMHIYVHCMIKFVNHICARNCIQLMAGGGFEKPCKQRFMFKGILQGGMSICAIAQGDENSLI